MKSAKLNGKKPVYEYNTTFNGVALELTGAQVQNGVWQKQVQGDEHAGEGVIVGVIDTGIWPENPSFAELAEPRSDADAIAAKWQGECVAVSRPSSTVRRRATSAAWRRRPGSRRTRSAGNWTAARAAAPRSS